MDANSFLGVGMYVLAGLSGACFYLPFKRVKQWSWESYWMICAVSGLLLSPWILAVIVSPNVLSVLRQTSWETLVLVLPVRGHVGRGRADLGTDDPLPGRWPGLAIGCGVCAVGGHADPARLPRRIGRLRPRKLGHRHAGGRGHRRARHLSSSAPPACRRNANFRGTKEGRRRRIPFRARASCSASSPASSSAGIIFGLDAGKAEIGAGRPARTPPTLEMWQGIPVGSWCSWADSPSISFGACASTSRTAPAAIMSRPAPPCWPTCCLPATAGVLWYSQLALLRIGNAKSGSLAFAGWTVFMSSHLHLQHAVGNFPARVEGREPSAPSRCWPPASSSWPSPWSVIGYGNYLKPPG